MSLPPPSMLEDIALNRVEPGEPAAAAICSLPVPPGAGPVSVPGLTSQSMPLAWWPERFGGSVPTPPVKGPYPSSYQLAGEPRRQLLTVCGDGDLPEQLRVQRWEADGPWAGPTWEVAILDRHFLGKTNWEVDELVLRHGAREVGLRVGLDTADDGLMWWEWVRVEELWSGPACKAIRAAGYASAFRLPADDPDARGYGSTISAHNQHWVLCDVHALLFANGVIHLTVHHVNSRMYDYGRDINGVLPIIGFRGAYDDDVPLVGETVIADLGGVKVSTEECRTFAGDERPGRLYARDGVAVLQPYEGVEIYLDGFGRRRNESASGYVVKADEKRLPVGVARTVRCCLSLGDAPPRVERYVPPLYWYGLCAELAPTPLLPVSDFRDATIDRAGAWLRDSQLTGNFDDGSVPRGGSHYRADGTVGESGWEGETPFNLVRYCYRRPSPENWAAALRDVYNVADIAVDHANFQFRMHGYDFGAVSPTMNRTLGLLQGYLETGDPYLRETAEHVALSASMVDASNWPRRSYGRDAMFIRGLIALEDYLPGRGWAVRAREALGRELQCPTLQGAYTDQAGPGGVHAAGNMVLKPWMNLMALEPMADWLERYPDDPELEAIARQIADWVLAQFIRTEDDAYWPYEVGWGENTSPPQATDPDAKHPIGHCLFFYPARTMLFASRRWDDPKYLQAWEDSFRAMGGYEPGAERVPVGGDHSANKASECLSWHQLHRWQATWEDGRLETSPYVLPGEDLQATVITPDGPVEVRAEG